MVVSGCIPLNDAIDADTCITLQEAQQSITITSSVDEDVSQTTDAPTESVSEVLVESATATAEAKQSVAMWRAENERLQLELLTAKVSTSLLLESDALADSGVTCRMKCQTGSVRWRQLYTIVMCCPGTFS